MLQSSLPTCFATPDLQAGSRNTAQIGSRAVARSCGNVGGAMARLRFATLRQPRSRTGFRAKAGSGGGNHTHLKKFMRLLSVL
jgi:hypothetical protein